MESIMQFITTLLGGSALPFLSASFALGAVLIGIVLVLWLLKLIAGHVGGLRTSKRQRLQVMESTVVDGKRRLVIIRRDDVEHVILTGGPQDLVVETGIPVPPAAPPPLRRPLRNRDAAPSPQQADEPAAGKVPHETVEQLGELARPAPLRPRNSVSGADVAARDEVFPKGPTLRIDNSADPEDDSANTSGDDSSAYPPGSARRAGRFSRGLRR